MLNQDYKDILSLLLAKKVDFLLVGAYAMAVHGFTRSTADIDILVKPSAENAKLIYESLIEFGAPLIEIKPADFENPGTVVQIGVAPRRIDILTQIDGLSFDEAADGKTFITIEDLRIPVISKINLIKNKRSTGREKDRLDAETLNNIS